MAKNPMGIQIVTVVGGGTMGNGIAHVCALSGREVRITDVSQEVLDLALEKVTAENTVRQELEAGESLATVFARHKIL